MEWTVRKIVVGVDGSEIAAAAARWVAGLADAVGAEVVLTSAWAPDQAEVPPDRYEEMRAGALDRLEHQWSEAVERAGVPWRAILSEDEPAAGLLASADSSGADLIVVGGHGAERSPVVHVGSVVHQLAHHTTRPLAVVPEASGDRPVKRIVVGVDGSSGSAAAVAFCARLAKSLGASVVAVLAREPMAEILPVLDAGDWTEDASRDLAGWSAPLHAAGLTVEERLIQSRDAVGTIVTVAEDQEADVIVVGTHGLSDVTGLRLGGVATALLDRVELPVVLVPPEAAA